MRILGFLLFATGLAWLTLTHLAAALPKAGNLTYRLQSLPAQETYTRQQVRDVIWEISAFRWSFPEQEIYTRQQVTNILWTASMDNPHKRDVSTPPVFVPVLLLVAGAFTFGIGAGKRGYGEHAAQPGAAPNGGPVTSVGSSKATKGPPSVS